MINNLKFKFLQSNLEWSFYISKVEDKYIILKINNDTNNLDIKYADLEETAYIDLKK